MFAGILKQVDAYYSAKLRAHGPTARGVDWNSPESQRLRFEQLLTVCDLQQPFTLNDYGCGYGGLLDYLTEQGYRCTYHGYDVSASMVEHAIELHHDFDHCSFTADADRLPAADYTVASGIFNVKLQTPAAAWTEYVLHTIEAIAARSRRGFAFNLLTSYADADKMRADLYYGDPCVLFDHCKRKYSRHVALLHDYGLYEFTLIVRR